MIPSKENASLRKSRAPMGDWRNYGKGKNRAPQTNPYANLQVESTSQSGFKMPKVPSLDKQKIKRRLSTKLESPMGPDFGSMPSLPSGALDIIAQQQLQLQHTQQQQQQQQQQYQNQQYQNQPLNQDQQGSGLSQDPALSAGPGVGVASGGSAMVPGGDMMGPAHGSAGGDRVPVKGRNKAGSFSVPLADPNFDAYRYVISQLQQATAADVENFTTELMSWDEKVDEDIKNNVNKSYEKILIVSNDLNTTEQELKGLKSTVSTLQEITGQMKDVAEARLEIESPSHNGSSQKSLPSIKTNGRRDRNSVMILEKRWVEELNSLFKHVEGAQKFLTAIPSRHVLAESGRWIELNAATWKPLQSSHLFVLNDHVLIASNKKRKNNPGHGRFKLVAEQCWPIREVKLIEIQDVKSQNGTGSNAGGSKETYFTINFKYHGSSFIFQTDKKDQYIKIISAFKKAQSQLRDITEQETLKQRKLRDSMSILSASDKSGKRNSNLLQDLSARMHTRTMSLNNSNTMRNLRDIDDMIDELDIDIAHHKFEAAVELIKVCDEQISQRRKEAKLGSSSSSEEVLVLLDVLKIKLEQRQGQLESALVFEINDELNTTEDINEYIFFLRTLDLTALAKENVLLSRSKLISRLTDEVDFEGDLPDYITQVSIIRFQTIKATTLLYKESFPESEYASDIVKWCTEEVKKHAELLKKQLFDVKIDSPIHKKCLEITQKQAADLKVSGLDVDFLLDSVYNK